MNKNYERSKWRKKIAQVEYKRFDKKGNTVEWGMYGETTCFSNVKDNIVTLWHTHNYKKLNYVDYYQFDSKNNKISDECWIFKDNKRNYLLDKTIFEYDSTGKLIKEVEYDKYNRITMRKDYFILGKNRTASKDSVFSFSDEGIAKVSYKSRYHNNK